MNAAREILSRINAMDPENDIFVQTKLEHETLYQDLGWENGGDMVFAVTASVTGDAYPLRAYIRRGTGGASVPSFDPAAIVSLDGSNDLIIKSIETETGDTTEEEDWSVDPEDENLDSEYGDTESEEEVLYSGDGSEAEGRASKRPCT